MTAPYSDARSVGGLTVFSGLVGRQPASEELNFEEQFRLMLEQLDERLARANLQRASVFKTTVWLADMTLWPRLNPPFADFFRDAAPPTRSTVGAVLLPGVLVELEAWAHKEA